jgi:hypothetical protein
MKSNFIKLILVSSFVSFVSAQFLDYPNWGDEDDGDDPWEDEESEESTVLVVDEDQDKVIKMSLSDIEDEKRLLQESSDIIMDVINSEVDEDMLEAYMSVISELISDHTVDLYNILHVSENLKEDETRSLKFNIIDIFLPVNDSVSRLNEIIESFYDS